MSDVTLSLAGLPSSVTNLRDALRIIVVNELNVVAKIPANQIKKRESNEEVTPPSRTP